HHPDDPGPRRCWDARPVSWSTTITAARRIPAVHVPGAHSRLRTSAAVLRDVRSPRHHRPRVEGRRLPRAAHRLRDGPLGAVPLGHRLLRVHRSGPAVPGSPGRTHRHLVVRGGPVRRVPVGRPKLRRTGGPLSQRFLTATTTALPVSSWGRSYPCRGDPIDLRPVLPHRCHGEHPWG